MNLEEEWKNLGAANTDRPGTDLNMPPNFDVNNSLLPQSKIKKSLKWGLYWIVVINIMYLIAIVYFDYFWSRLCICILITYNIFYFFKTLNLAKSIQPYVVASNSLRAEMERNYLDITKWLNAQMRDARYLYPISITGGFLGGLSISGPEFMAKLMHKPWLWLILLACFCILIPLCTRLARWMVYKAYGVHLDHLKKMLDALEA